MNIQYGNGMTPLYLYVLDCFESIGIELSIDEITVEAWKKNKKRFGLGRFWQEHPNSHRIYTEVARLIHTPSDSMYKPRLYKVSPNRYTLTNVGYGLLLAYRRGRDELDRKFIG